MNQNQIELFVIEAKEGKKSALKVLYSHFVTPMRRYALMRTRDIMVAEDLVHNVWIKIDKRIHRLNDTTVFRSWLFRALTWEILDWIKSNSKFQLDDGTELDTLEGQSQLELTKLIPLMRSLTQAEQDVVELYYLNDLTLFETALALSIPEGTVKSRLSSAREKMRKNIARGY